jgi:hypothetical protein
VSVSPIRCTSAHLKLSRHKPNIQDSILSLKGFVSNVGSHRVFLISSLVYVVTSSFFFFALIFSSGDVAQQDWGFPLTASASLNNLHSAFFYWQYTGFGSVQSDFSNLFFSLLTAVIVPLGFVGGTLVKVLSVSLVAISGIITYSLAKSLGLRSMSSFLAGLFYMTTPVVFDWIMFGWVYYLIGYALLPLMILATRLFLQTNRIQYALLGGIILAIALEVTAFVLLYPLIVLLFVIFESRGNREKLISGLVFTAISLFIWFLSYLYFFVVITNPSTYSFYQGAYFGVIQAQFSHLSVFTNPIRLWGSTYNFQFETYFPKDLILLSFGPLLIAACAILTRTISRRVTFFASLYLIVLVPQIAYNNLHYLVFKLPLGAIFEAPSIFLVPASLGLAVLMGYTNETFSRMISSHGIRPSFARLAPSLVILILIIAAGIPWWTGQVSGTPIGGPPTKLNLYQMPTSYTEWNKLVNADNEHFVLYIPGFGYSNIANTSYFSGQFQAVNSAIYYLVNSLPYVSTSNGSLLLNQLLTENSQVGESWGSYSIKYIVVYTNVLPPSPYNMPYILNRLSVQNGIREVLHLQDVAVFEDEYAKPVVYSNSSNASTVITYHDPTTYRVTINSTAPYLLILNQAYSSGWQASLYGKALPAKDHVRVSGGLNGWYINSSGTMTVSISFAPQAIYFASVLVSITAFFGILIVLISITVRSFLLRRQNHA